MVFLLIGLTACSGGTMARDTSTTDVPPPAAAAEVEQVCSRYQEVRNLDFGTMVEELLDVAPAELSVHIIKVINLDEDWESNQRAIWDFLDRCEE